MSGAGPRPGRLRRFVFPDLATRKRMLRREAWFVVIVSYVAIGVAYGWPASFRNTSPAFVAVAWTAFMIRTFLFHAGLLYATITVVALIARNRRLGLAALPLVLVALGPTVPEYFPRPPQTARGAITVMSINLLAVNEDTAGIIAEIEQTAPDILLVQEYSDHWHAALQGALAADYPHAAWEIRDDSFGAAVYSRLPFLEPVDKRLPLGSATEPQMRAVIAIGSEPVAFFNVHPLPPRNLEYVTEARLQIADLAELLKAERLPAVVAGDFNFTENSPQFDLLTGIGLTETHALAGWGRGDTWPNSPHWWLPVLRLDRIFLSRELTAIESRVGTGRGSDHRPVIARVGLRSP